MASTKMPFKMGKSDALWRQGCQMAYFRTKNILKGLAMKDVGTLYGQLVYFTAIVAPLW
jgi:hypothetical protein